MHAIDRDEYRSDGLPREEALATALPVRLEPRPVAVEGALAKRSATEPALVATRLPAPPLSPEGPVPVGRRLRRALWMLPVGAGLWALLSGGGADSWAFGAPAVLAASALAYATTPASRWRVSAGGLLRFSAFFAVQSVLGALDVARRALAWRMPLAPGFARYRDRLPNGAPRILFANTITLLPGTLSAELHADHVVVHMLDARMDMQSELDRLETRVIDLFALAPKASKAEARP